MHKWSNSRCVQPGGLKKSKDKEGDGNASPPPLPIPDEKDDASSNSDSLSSIELKIEGSDDDDSGCSLEEFAWIPPNLKPELVKTYFSQIPKHKIPYVNSVGEKYRIRQMLYQLPPQDTEAKYCSGLSGEEEKELKMFAESRRQEALGRGSVKQLPSSLEYPFGCGNCKEPIGKTELGIFAIRAGLHTCWHPACFVCCVCKELLVDLVYFYKDEKLYCGRHHAETLKPRCSACDELIFADECTEAERRAWHIKHFCCCECDAHLGGKRYIMEDGRPHCIDCYDQLFANTCDTCQRLISVDEGEMSHESCHWHATKSCFRCQYCHFSLLGRPFLPRKEKIFCSLICYGREQRRGSSKSCLSSKPSLVPSFEFNFDSEMSLELKCLSESSRDNGRSLVSDVSCDTLSLSRGAKPQPEKEDFEIKRSPKSVFYKQRGKNNPSVKPRPIRRVKSSPERQRPPIKLLSRSQAVNTDLTFLPRTVSNQMISKGVQVNVPEATSPPETTPGLTPIREDDPGPPAEISTTSANRKSADIEVMLRGVGSDAPIGVEGEFPEESGILIPRSKSSSCIINKIISKEELKKLHDLLHLLSTKQLTLVPRSTTQQLSLFTRDAPQQIPTDKARPDRHKPLSKSSQLPRKTYTQCDSNSGTDNYDWFIPGSKGCNSIFTESLNSINLSRTFAQKLSKSCPPPSSGDGCSTCSSTSCDEEEFDAPLKRPFPPIIDTHKLPLSELYSQSLPRNTNFPSKVGSKRFRFFRERQSNCIVS